MKEIEAKFTVATNLSPTELVAGLDFPDGLMLTDRITVHVEDVYLDTPDFRLARHGYIIRFRHKNGQQLITLKSLSGSRDIGLQNRLEIERAIGTGREVLGMQQWPQEIRDVVIPVVGSESSWQLICTIVQEREKHIVRLPAVANEQPLRLAELSIDDVMVKAPSRDEKNLLSSGTDVRFGEIEIELLDEDHEQALNELAIWFGNQPGVKPIGGNKLIRGMNAIASTPLVGSVEQNGIQPSMQMADACRLLWRQQMTMMIISESGVRADTDVEFVHAMGVATDRARATYILFGDYLRRKQVRAHRILFERTARRIGHVDDMDVALRQLSDYRQTLPKEERSRLKPVAKYWRKERKKRLARLTKWLDSDTYSTALIDLDRFCTTSGMGAKQQKSDAVGAPTIDQVRFVLPSRIVACFEGVRRYETVLEQNELAEAATLHALSVDCDYLRSVLEFSRQLLGEEGEALIDQLKLLQDVLDDLDDKELACLMLRGLPESLLGIAIDNYLDRQTVAIDELRQQVVSIFTEFVGYPNRRLLASAIARI